MRQKFTIKRRVLLFDILLLLWTMWMLISEWVQHATTIHFVLNVACYAAMVLVITNDIQQERGKRQLPRIYFTIGGVVLFVVLVLYLLSLIVAAVK